MEPSEKEAVRARTDIVELVSGYTTLKKSGSRYKGLCPFHQEKTPSFTVDAERGLWHCFGSCSTGGDVFSFLMKAEGLSFIEAAEQLAERAGVTLTRAGGDPEAARRTQDERERLYAVSALAQRFFRETFARASLARDYAARRGLAHETLEAFGIGFAPDDWEALAEYLIKSGAHLPDAEKAGLLFPSRRGDGWTDRFRGRLMFPILDVQERVAGFGGRLLVPAENAPKYLNSPETPIFSKGRILYGLNRARKAVQEQDRVVVVEGYMDAVAAHQAGLPYVVATLGTALGEEHIRLLGRYTKNVILSFDADEAGVRAALRAAALFEAAGGFALHILALPPGDDPDAMLARGEVAAFKKAVAGAPTVPEFRLRALEARFDTATEEGKLAFLREALLVVAEVPSPLERDLLVRRLAPFHPAFPTGGARAEESLRAELSGHLARGGPASYPDPPPAASPVRLENETILPRGRGGGAPRRGWSAPPARRGSASPAPPPAPPAPPRRTAGGQAEQTLLRALLSDLWVEQVRGRLDPDDFPDPGAARLLDALLPLVDGGYRPSDAIDLLTDADLADYARSLAMLPDEEPLSEQSILDCLRLLAVRREARALQQIQAELAQPAEGNRVDDDELLRRWDQKARAMKRVDG